MLFRSIEENPQGDDSSLDDELSFLWDDEGESDNQTNEPFGDERITEDEDVSMNR